MDLTCPHCTARLPEDAYSEALDMGRCPRCGRDFKPSTSTPAPARQRSGTPRPASTARTPAPGEATNPLEELPPEGVQREVVGNQLVVRLAWSNPRTTTQLFLVGGVVAVLAILVFALPVYGGDRLPTLWAAGISALFVGPFLYYAVAHNVNASQLEFLPARIRLSHTPLPWPTGGVVHAELVALYLENHGTADQPNIELVGVTADDEVTVLDGIYDRIQAEYLIRLVAYREGLETRPPK